MLKDYYDMLDTINDYVITMDNSTGLLHEVEDHHLFHFLEEDMKILDTYKIKYDG